MPLITVPMTFIPVQVIADVYGPWAIHNAVDVDDRWFMLTHVGTGHAVFLCGVTYEACVAALREFEASTLDWSLPNGIQDLTPDHKTFGRSIREKYNAVDGC